MSGFSRKLPLVLGYHVLGPALPRRQDPSNLVIEPERFRSQIERLRRRGYRFLDLPEFAAAATAEEAEGCCAVTFDDGSQDNLTVLAPLLEEIRVPATAFVCPGLLGRPHPFLAPETGIRLMNESEVARLAAGDWVAVGSHTDHHTELWDATEAEAYEVMASSRSALERIVGGPVPTFAYPNCGYSPACPAAAERAGYKVAVTCGMRGSWAPLELRRELIDGLDRGLTFELKTRGTWRRLYDSPPGRLARAAARPLRHGRAAESRDGG